ncbi:LuxR C-terminal-related transcriptional regulator [Streptomyces sp. SAS_276]|uniref:LuxR C-terminal-related transcriptional regulator n=1 Tax=Streptomyces sp. SAS_276 TaxID=3412745 RepID=UPI00403D3617
MLLVLLPVTGLLAFTVFGAVTQWREAQTMRDFRTATQLSFRATALTDAIVRERIAAVQAGLRPVPATLKERSGAEHATDHALDAALKGGSVVDPSLVHELFSAQRRDDPLSFLGTREREVLALMAEGRSNAGIGRRLWVTEGTVEKHVRSILGELRLPEASDDHRRVLAVLTFLESR